MEVANGDDDAGIDGRKSLETKGWRGDESKFRRFVGGGGGGGGLLGEKGKRKEPP